MNDYVVFIYYFFFSFYHLGTHTHAFNGNRIAVSKLYQLFFVVRCSNTFKQMEIAPGFKTILNVTMSHRKRHTYLTDMAFH